MNTDTPRTNKALAAILDKDGYLSEDNAPDVLVKLCRTMERERDNARESRAEVVEKYQAAVKEMHETGAQRDEAIEIARKAMGTVMQIYGHAQFCNECQSFEIADSCRSQMHDMDRINSLLTECKRNENES